MEDMTTKRLEEASPASGELEEALDQLLGPKDRDWALPKTAAAVPANGKSKLAFFPDEVMPFVGTDESANTAEEAASPGQKPVSPPAPQPARFSPRPPRPRGSILHTLSRSAAVLILAGVVAFFVEQFVISRPASPAPADTSTAPVAAKSDSAGASDGASASVSPAPVSEVGRLVVKSNPPGLKVEIVNEALQTIAGLTPMVLENEPIGKYTITIRKDGAPDHRQQVNLEPNGSVTVDHAFQETPVAAAPIPAQSQTPGSDVASDSNLLKPAKHLSLLPEAQASPKPQTSPEGQALPKSPASPGLAASPDSKPVSVNPPITPNPKPSPAVESERAYGLVSVTSDRADAEVFIGGVDRGQPPIEEILPVGPQQIIARAPGMPEQTRTIDVKSGERELMQINFSQAATASEAPSPSRPSSPSAETKRGPSHSASNSGESRLRQHHPQSSKTAAQKSKHDRPRAAADPSCPVDSSN